MQRFFETTATLFIMCCRVFCRRKADTTALFVHRRATAPFENRPSSERFPSQKVLAGIRCKARQLRPSEVPRPHGQVRGRRQQLGGWNKVVASRGARNVPRSLGEIRPVFDGNRPGLLRPLHTETFLRREKRVFAGAIAGEFCFAQVALLSNVNWRKRSSSCSGFLCAYGCNYHCRDREVFCAPGSFNSSCILSVFSCVLRRTVHFEQFYSQWGRHNDVSFYIRTFPGVSQNVALRKS